MTLTFLRLTHRPAQRKDSRFLELKYSNADECSAPTHRRDDERRVSRQQFLRLASSTLSKHQFLRLNLNSETLPTDLAERPVSADDYYSDDSAEEPDVIIITKEKEKRDNATQTAESNVFEFNREKIDSILSDYKKRVAGLTKESQLKSKDMDENTNSSLNQETRYEPVEHELSEIHKDPKDIEVTSIRSINPEITTKDENQINNTQINSNESSMKKAYSTNHSSLLDTVGMVSKASELRLKGIRSIVLAM